MVFAVRTADGRPKLTGLPELLLRGLANRDAAALLESAMTGRLDERVRESHPGRGPRQPTRSARAASPAVLHGAGLRARPRTGDARLVSRLEEGFLRRLQDLPPQARQLILLAAADPVGDVDLLRRAAERVGIGPDAAGTADTPGLLELRHRVEFRHPLVRSAVYRAATSEERRNAHEALADVTDPDTDPDRRAWHRARAAAGPDEAVAAELEQSADRARARRTRGRSRIPGSGREPDPRPGAPGPALPGRRPGEGDRRRVRGRAGAVGGRAGRTARRGRERAGPAPAGPDLPLLPAWQQGAAAAAGRRPPAGADRPEACPGDLPRRSGRGHVRRPARRPGPTAGCDRWPRRCARSGCRPHRASPTCSSKGSRCCTPTGTPRPRAGLLDTVRAFGSDDLTMDEAVRFAWLAACAATDLWDDLNWGVLTRRHLDAIRDIGALGVLPVALNSRIIYDLYSGDLAEAESLVAEAEWVADITGGQNAMIPYGEVSLNAMRGGAARAEPQFEKVLSDINARGEGVGLNMIGWFQAIMFNGLGRYDEALEAARPGRLAPGARTAQVGAGRTRRGRRAQRTTPDEAAERARAALLLRAGQRHRCGAGGAGGAKGRSLRTGNRRGGLPTAKRSSRLGRTTLRVEHARAQLRYGEWLRREGRRADARTQLRLAYEALSAMGVDAFAERARKELAATGETIRQRAVETSGDLTAQEAHIARLVAEGLTNPEIGAALFISPRTVEWHLRKVFTKLGVTTRRQLRQSLPGSPQQAQPS